MALIAIVTNAGRAALVNAANTGTAPVTISQVGLTATAVVPGVGITALPGEYKRVPTISGDVVADDTIHLIVRDESVDVFTVRSFALYLADGTLFAVYGQADVILEKSAQAMMLLAIDVQFADVDADLLTFGDANFLNPPATTEIMGVVELSTEDEATTGVDTTRAVTPKSMKTAVTSWINSRFGDGAPSAFVKTLLTITSAALMRGALELKGAALKDEGAGNNLDADLLDGQHGAYYANIPARLGYIPWGPNNDGAGSGLDADLFDGLDSGYYTNITARLGYTPLNKAGDTVTGDFKVNADLWSYRAGGAIGILYLNAAGTRYLLNNGSAYELPGQDLYVNGAVAWTAGNDGSGSTLDADLLDGQQGAWYADITARLGYTPLNVTAYTAADVKAKLLTVDGSGSGVDADLLDGQDGSYYSNIIARLGYTPLNKAGDTVTGDFKVNADLWSYRTGGAIGIIYLNAAGTRYVLNNGSAYVMPGQELYVNNSLAWTAGNDGSGSGSDADMLDGLHASAFAILANFTGTNQALTASGFQKLPGGLIVQWGQASHTDNTGSQLVTFPMAFPNGGFVGLASNVAAAAPSAFHATGNMTASNMRVYSSTASGSPAASGTAFTYFAIGY